jgi:hypothetical protein
MSIKLIPSSLLLGLLFLGLSPALAENAPPPEAARLPWSSLIDFSSTLEKPAGKRGFLRGSKDGHFEWDDGTRARFWGINISSTRLDIPPRQIEQVVSNFARAGMNLVRLEAIDNRNCLLGKQDASDSLHFDKHYLDCLDRWMDAQRRHGIYYYLDLLDFRTFKKGDGVLNAEAFDRAARPYALYDRYLIALQKDYATKLLTHRNPYSKLRIVDDPAFALVEICNEHGFFLYPEKLESLVEPYAADLTGRWNDWLLAKYQGRAQLEGRWGVSEGQPVLRDEEDPTRKTVALPILANNMVDRNGPDVTAARRAPIRQRDGVEFLTTLQRSYFQEMREHLRSIGVRIPVTAVVSSDVAPDVASVAQECDFTSENWYGEGINGDPQAPDLRFYNNRNTVRSDDTGGFAPYTAALRWNNKPVVVREWASTWPNQFRSVSEPEALAYSSLQDFDAVLLFGYQTNRAPNGALADALNDFAFQNDPSVWGLHAIAGQAFLTRAIRPAQNTVTLAYPSLRQFVWPNRSTDLRRAAWCTRINSIVSDTAKGPLTASPTGTPKDLQALRNVLDALGKKSTGISADNIVSGTWRSDTGEIVRYSRQGRLEIRTPRLSVVSGDLSPNATYDMGLFRISTPTHFGTIIAYSVDKQPMRSSRHIVVKMVSRASNSGEQFEPSGVGSPGSWVLRTPGVSPVVTFGRPSSQPTRIWLTTDPEPAPVNRATAKLASRGNSGDRKPKQTAKAQGPAKLPKSPMLMLYMEDGTWELEMIDGKATVVCDTGGIAGNLLGRSFTTMNGPLQIADGPSSDRFQAH